MKQEIFRGAEAVVYLDIRENPYQPIIIKSRIKKDYRIKELDEKLRKFRTKREVKLLEKSSGIINVPKVLEFNDFDIITEYIDGEKLSSVLDSLNEKEREKVCFLIGESLAKLHNNDIIHGDLTTSNIILKDNKTYFIDFGLGSFSNKIEDKAVDLHLLRQALKSRHYLNFEKSF
ncbi:Kae1-associated serine/threonine protein kinase, partial [Candidatus Woesearchaeota archaeon]|nr:Kae1-associated serine/threonine protein kinase [Candidatus Woesearchaeota archaeon]